MERGPGTQRSRSRAGIAIAGLSIGLFLAASLAASRGMATELVSLVRWLPGGDTSGHFLLAGLPALCLVASRHRITRRASPAHNALLAIAGLATLVTIDELLQISLSRRSFSIADLVANYSGIAVFSLIGFSILRKRRSQTASLAQSEEPLISGLRNPIERP